MLLVSQLHCVEQHYIKQSSPHSTLSSRLSLHVPFNLIFGTIPSHGADAGLLTNDYRKMHALLLVFTAENLKTPGLIVIVF